MVSLPNMPRAAQRYFRKEQGDAWCDQLKELVPQMARIAITPEWVSIIDFEKRFPSAIAAQLGDEKI
jgi:hypothetical protein